MQGSEILIAQAQHKNELVHQLHEQAYETELKQLDNNQVTKAIEYLLENPHFGFFFIYTENQHIFGQILMTKEYNIYSGLTCWFQSVYVKKDHRQRGIYKQMYKEFMKYAAKEKAAGTKLYVEFENKNAIKVYEKLGMIRTEETIFEDDFVFHPVKIINLGQDCVTRTSSNKKELEDLLKKGKSIIGNDLTQQLQIEYCLNNNKNAFIITESQTDYLIGLYFIEFSDWRNGIIIWFYDFISSTYNNGIISIMMSNMLNQIKHKKIKLNPEVKGIRILVDRSKGQRLEQLLEVIGLKESHYYIYYQKSD
ncbi:unnamed protein product [Paramecium primaurelia]|uniref:N-acetyltransferase domain-containing protein n=1 Tax=Paramecium primaurelia TaxID=5886 RepID=A0A8S1L5A9_PARPR|nr:unnamed protein product [Paramecium primaurelia]